MTAKQILFAQQAQRQMLDGVNAMARAVAVTLGPRGRHVLIDKSWGHPASPRMA